MSEMWGHIVKIDAARADQSGRYWARPEVQVGAGPADDVIMAPKRRGRDEVGGVIGAAGAVVPGPQRVREHRPGPGNRVGRGTPFHRDDPVGGVTGFDPVDQLWERVEGVELLAAESAVVDTRHHEEPGEPLRSCQSTVEPGEPTVIVDGLDRRDIRVGPAVPEDELAPGAPKAAQVKAERVALH